MAEENVVLLEVKTLDAVKSVKDLKENISALKHNLGELEIGTEAYTETLNALKTNQNLLKDAMYATSASLDDVKASATGASESYNSLVHRMAALKEEWRATNDEARRNEVGKQIAEINQQLKDMDASVGNFQRNVGNYESGVTGLVEKFDQWGGILKQMPPTLGAAKESIGKVGETMQLVGKQPILGIIGLLAPTIIKITEALGENETAMEAVKKVMASLQPIFDVFEMVLEKIAQGIARVAEWFVNLLGESGDTFKNIISGAVGVGNVLLQYLLTPIRTIVNAFKGLGKIIGDVFKGNFKDIKKDAEEAWGGIKDSFIKGFSFKENFDLGKKVGEEFASGLGASKGKVVEEGEKIGEEVAKSIENKLMEIDWNKVSAANAKRIAAEKAAKEAAAKEQQELNDMVEAEWEATNAEIDAYFEEIQQKELESKKRAEEMAKARVDSMYAVADATSSVLGSLASMYESDEENAEKNAGKIKALRIAEATINTISGAIGAYMSAVTSLPAPYGLIVGAAQAASVTAAGMAQIAQIRKTKVGTSGTSSAPSAVVSAPQVETNLPSVRSVTTATEEERLNQMAQDSRVYIVSSDIEAALNDNKTRVEESSF
jgi:hypothetical protein